MKTSKFTFEINWSLHTTDYGLLLLSALHSLFLLLSCLLRLTTAGMSLPPPPVAAAPCESAWGCYKRHAARAAASQHTAAISAKAAADRPLPYLRELRAVCEPRARRRRLLRRSAAAVSSWDSAFTYSTFESWAGKITSTIIGLDATFWKSCLRYPMGCNSSMH